MMPTYSLTFIVPCAGRRTAQRVLCFDSDEDAVAAVIEDILQRSAWSKWMARVNEWLGDEIAEMPLNALATSHSTRQVITCITTLQE